ncbi:hypothetical protein ES319_A09G256400v1 [Gossypium barbadense]|uniref:Desiccation-related protein PCC13-62 n=2 Tax=Gossypium TaxID=3633 RepID=A0A2P5W6M3_GOSBA|nr:hypothetical protein ES319_A09G256400v1 [Gossypium barbadense]PPR86760.1 hypothetical protein GOBAR_AA33930 [Gossypium barbadense]TYH04232.1 hypothetical protein ES288_A09G282500v1 [Gossypium darwinii]
MALAPCFVSFAAIVFISSFINSLLLPSAHPLDLNATILPIFDVDLLEFSLNLEYLEADFFLFGSFGQGLERVAPNLTRGSPPPIGAQKANLDSITNGLILQFGYQEVGHIKPLQPPFNPYANNVSFLIAAYLIPYVGLTGYVDTIPKLFSTTSRKLVSGLLGIESGQDAVIRALLYPLRQVKVPPYDIDVDEFTRRISNLRNTLGRAGSKDEGLTVQVNEGAEGRVQGNVLAGDQFSLAYNRTPEEILRIVYGSGNASIPGGFFPKGAGGRIARSHLPNGYH